MKKVISIFLSILILVGSSGATIAIHYCSGQAVKLQMIFIQTGLDCGMKKMGRECLHKNGSSKTHIKMKNCCEDNYQSIDTGDKIASHLELKSPDLKFFVIVAFTYLDMDLSQLVENTEYLNYYPPLIERDIPVLVQSFLI